MNHTLLAANSHISHRPRYKYGSHPMRNSVWLYYIPAQVVSIAADEGVRVLESGSLTRGRLAAACSALSKCSETSVSRSQYHVLICFAISSSSRSLVCFGCTSVRITLPDNGLCKVRWDGWHFIPCTLAR